MSVDERTDRAGHDAISWDPPDEGEWTLEAAHGSSLVPVPYRALSTTTFSEGTRRGLEPFGLPLSHAEMHFVNGWPYFSFFAHDVPRSAGKPPPAWVIKAITRVHPGFRRRTKIARSAIRERRAERIAAEWFSERSRWIDRILDVQRVDLAALDDAALADHFDDAKQLAVEGVTRHFALVFASIPLGRWLLRAEQWGLPPADVRNAVMHSTPVHEEARARLSRISAAIGDARPSDLEEVRAHSTEAAAALDDYLEHHGRWATGDSVTGRTLEEHPRAVMASILRQRAQPDPGVAAAAILDRLRSAVPSADRDEFDRLAADAHETYKMLDDNSGILAAWTSGVMSTVLRTATDRLVADGRIDDTHHVWALELDEIVALLRGTSSATPAQIAEAFTDWQRLGDLDPPPYLGPEPGDPPDPSWFPAPVAELMTAFFAFFEDKFNEGGTAVGIGDTPVEGRAIVVEEAADALDRMEPGDVLVTTATNPSYNTVLGIAGGVVVSAGGLSSHTAVVARELGIPALVGYADALERIPDGSRVRLDPSTATVTVVS